MIRLRAVKPGLAEELAEETLPALLRRRRRALGLKTAEAADVFGIAEWSYRAWERGLSEPAARKYPKVIEFLGHEPWSPPVSLRERFRAERLRRGLMIQEASALVGIHSTKLGQFERHPEREWSLAFRLKVEALFGQRRT